MSDPRINLSEEEKEIRRLYPYLTENEVYITDLYILNAISEDRAVPLVNNHKDNRKLLRSLNVHTYHLTPDKKYIYPIWVK